MNNHLPHRFSFLNILFGSWKHLIWLWGIFKLGHLKLYDCERQRSLPQNLIVGYFRKSFLQAIVEKTFWFWTQFWKFWYFRKLWASGHNKVQKTYLFMIDFGLLSLNFENDISLEEGSRNFKTNLQRNILFENEYIIERYLGS